MKTKYVCQLPTEISEDINKEVKKALYYVGLRDNELDDAIENAMNSRLCDLADTIDITKYLNNVSN
jgi:hypothetical protein